MPGGRISLAKRGEVKDQPQPSPSLDLFAEMLSLEVTPYEAARRMGLKAETGKVMLRRLRDRLGPQAV